jgi:hypothetical protein
MLVARMTCGVMRALISSFHDLNWLSASRRTTLNDGVHLCREAYPALLRSRYPERRDHRHNFFEREPNHGGSRELNLGLCLATEDLNGQNLADVAESPAAR